MASLKSLVGMMPPVEGGARGVTRSAPCPPHASFGETNLNNAARSNRILFLCNFLSKGWEVGVLGLLAFIQAKFNMPLYMVGILSMVFIVSQISISAFAGKIAHKLHSRNVLLLSIASSGFCWLTLFLSGHLYALFPAYMLGGIASGLFEPIANSLVAKSSTSKERGTKIGNFAAFGDMGRISVVAGTTALAGLYGVNNACIGLFSTAVIAFVLALLFIRRAPDSEVEAAGETPLRMGELLQNRRFRLATAAGIADSFSSASLYIFIPFLLLAKGITIGNTLYFNVIFFFGYMSGRLALGRLADRFGAANTLMVSEISMAGLILLLTVVSGNSMTLIFALLYFLGIFTRGTSPIIRAMVADSMDERVSFHDAFSAYSFASRSSSAVCRPIFGFLASFSGIGAVFYAASVVSLLTLYPAAQYKTANKSGHNNARGDESTDECKQAA